MIWRIGSCEDQTTLNPSMVSKFGTQRGNHACPVKAVAYARLLVVLHRHCPEDKLTTLMHFHAGASAILILHCVRLAIF